MSETVVLETASENIPKETSSQLEMDPNKSKKDPENQYLRISTKTDQSIIATDENHSIKRVTENLRSASLSSDDAYLEAMDETAVKHLARAQSTDSLDSSLSILGNNDCDSAPNDFGQVQVRFFYEYGQHVLHVWLLQSADIIRMNAKRQNQENQPQQQIWCVLFLLPHPKPLWRTQLRTSTPGVVSFNEHFRQCVRPCDLTKIALLCQTYTKLDSDPSQATMVGQSRMRLKDVRVDEPTSLWLSLLPQSQDELQADTIGELLFSLTYAPCSERLTVVVSKIRQLAHDVHNSSVIQIRAYLVMGAQVLKKKTSTQSLIDGASDFNETMFFSLSPTKLAKSQLRISIGQVYSASEHRVLGHVTVGSRRTGKQLGHWQQLLANPRKPIVMWHDVIAKHNTNTVISP